jgi:hypothetical protein
MKDKTNKEIVKCLMEAMKLKDQTLINKYAYELAERLYMPSIASNFDELLYGFGYREIDPLKEKQISIEEYMRERKKDDKE